MASQASSALHMMAVLQVFQAKPLRDLDESGRDPNTFKELRTVPGLALRTTKATVQSIGKAMANLAVVELDGDQGSGMNYQGDQG